MICKYRRVWSELNAFKDHLLIKIEFFILTTLQISDKVRLNQF